MQGAERPDTPGDFKPMGNTAVNTGLDVVKGLFQALIFLPPPAGTAMGTVYGVINGYQTARNCGFLGFNLKTMATIAASAGICTFSASLPGIGPFITGVAGSAADQFTSKNFAEGVRRNYSLKEAAWHAIPFLGPLIGGQERSQNTSYSPTLGSRITRSENGPQSLLTIVLKKLGTGVGRVRKALLHIGLGNKEVMGTPSTRDATTVDSKLAPSPSTRPGRSAATERPSGHLVGAYTKGRYAGTSHAEELLTSRRSTHAPRRQAGK